MSSAVTCGMSYFRCPRSEAKNLMYFTLRRKYVTVEEMAVMRMTFFTWIIHMKDEQPRK